MSEEEKTARDMGNLVSTSPAPSSSPPPPWTHLRQPARISLLGLSQTGKKSLLQYMASQDPKEPAVTQISPSLFVFLDVLRCGPLTVACQTVGLSKPQAFVKDVDEVRKNADGVIWMVDCSDRERWPRGFEDLDQFVLAPQELKGAPLLVLANKYNADGALSIEEIEQGFRQPPSGWGCRGVERDERPFAVKKVDAETGQGIKEALEWMVDTVNVRRQSSSD